jgi:hypothetical protein
VNKRRKERKPKPEEHEGIPQHLHCPLANLAEIGTQSNMKSSRKTML